MDLITPTVIVILVGNGDSVKFDSPFCPRACEKSGQFNKSAMDLNPSMIMSQFKRKTATKWLPSTW